MERSIVCDAMFVDWKKREKEKNSELQFILFTFYCFGWEKIGETEQKKNSLTAAANLINSDENFIIIYCTAMFEQQKKKVSIFIVGRARRNSRAERWLQP